MPTSLQGSMRRTPRNTPRSSAKRISRFRNRQQHAPDSDLTTAFPLLAGAERTSASCRPVSICEDASLRARRGRRLAADLAFGTIEEARDVLAMADKQQEREDGEEQRRGRPAAEPERDRRRRACDQGGE